MKKMQGSTMAIGVGDVKPVFDNNQLDKPNIEKNMEKNNEKISNSWKIRNYQD